MSNRNFLRVTAVLGAGVALVFAADRGLGLSRGTAIKSRPTHEQLAERQRPRSVETQREVSRDEVLKPAHRNKRQSNGLVGRSSILSSNSSWTIVPKGSILYVPTLFEKRVEGTRNGKLTNWQEFHGKNRGWIRELPVTIAQARGEEPIAEEYIESIKKAGQVVIAVCRGGPISVKIPEEPQAEGAPAESGPEDASEHTQRGSKESDAVDAGPATPEDKAARDARELEDLKRRLRLRSN